MSLNESDIIGAVKSSSVQGEIVVSDASAAYELSSGLSDSSTSLSGISSPSLWNIYSAR